MFDWKKPTVQMLGRWQPWHEGHLALFKKAIETTGQVCIMIRNMPENNNNPFNSVTVKNNIIKTLKKEGFSYDVEYIIINVPNVVDISYGRDVGYTFTEHNLGNEIHKISGTNIRNEIL